MNPPKNVDREAAEDSRVQGLKKRFTSLGASLARSRKTKASRLEEGVATIERQLNDLAVDDSLEALKNHCEQVSQRADELASGLDRTEARIKRECGFRVDAVRRELEETRAENRGLICEFSKEANDRLFALSVAQTKAQKAFSESLEQKVMAGLT